MARTITKGTYKLVSAGRHEIELLQVSGVLDDMAVDGSHKQWLGTFKVDQRHSEVLPSRYFYDCTCIKTE